AFDAAHGKVRVVTLLSPTCAACTHGAQVVQADVLEPHKGKDVAAFVVWLPMLGGEKKEAAVNSSGLISDPRALQYWDGARQLGKQYAQVVNLPNGKPVAWDVYFVYGLDAKWGD